MTEPLPPKSPQPQAKSLKVSEDSHRRVHDIARALNGNADDAVRSLLDPNQVRVRVTEIQRRRWQEAADEAGVSLPEFIMMRVEGALFVKGDMPLLVQMNDTVTALARNLGLK